MSRQKKTATILLPSIIPWIDLSTKTLEEIKDGLPNRAKDIPTVLNSFIGIKVKVDITEAVTSLRNDTLFQIF